LAQEAGADLVGINSRLGTEQAHGQLLFAHLQRKNPNRDAAHHGDIAGDGEGQGGLAHTGAGRNDDQVRGLKARRQFVQVRVMAGHPGDHLTIFLEPFYVLDALFDDLLERRITGANPTFGHGKDRSFRLIQDLFHILAATIT